MGIVLGTAQFGLDYGITNSNGKVSYNDVVQILKYAERNGIKILDTASAYGDCEHLFGQLKKYFSNFSFISKIKVYPDDDLNKLHKRIDDIYQKMQISKLYALMVHNSEFMLSSTAPKVWGDLIKAKVSKSINKIGVSVYNVREAIQIIKNYDIDIIQIPFNIINQQFLNEDFIYEARKRNVEIHARSIFMQGLLFLDQDSLPNYFRSLKSKYVDIQEDCDHMNKSREEYIAQFLKDNMIFDNIVLGVTNVAELDTFVSAWKYGYKSNSKSKTNWGGYSVLDEFIIDPSYWPKEL